MRHSPQFVIRLSARIKKKSTDDAPLIFYVSLRSLFPARCLTLNTCFIDQGRIRKYTKLFVDPWTFTLKLKTSTSKQLYSAHTLPKVQKPFTYLTYRRSYVPVERKIFGCPAVKLVEWIYCCFLQLNQLTKRSNELPNIHLAVILHLLSSLISPAFFICLKVSHCIFCIGSFYFFMFKSFVSNQTYYNAFSLPTEKKIKLQWMENRSTRLNPISGKLVGPFGSNVIMRYRYPFEMKSV